MNSCGPTPKKGLFTVKSGYHMILENRLFEEGNAGSADEDIKAKVWNKLWKLKMVPKIKSFLWRCGKEIIPCKTNLMRRKIRTDDLCELCGTRESPYHVLFECWPAKAVWKAAVFDHKLRESDGSGFAVLMEVILHRKEAYVQEWAAYCWGIWNARNKRLFEQVCKEPHEVISDARHLLGEFMRYNDVTGKVILQTTDLGDHKWQAPGAGFVKLNCDAMCKVAGAGVGFVARNDRGHFCYAGAKRVQDTTCPELAEAEAISWALHIAGERGTRRIRVESDSLAVISKIKNKCIGRGPLYSMIDHIRTISVAFETVLWTHIRREGNSIAHSLASIYPTCQTVYLFLDSLPVNVCELVLMENE